MRQVTKYANDTVYDGSGDDGKLEFYSKKYFRDDGRVLGVGTGRHTGLPKLH